MYFAVCKTMDLVDTIKIIVGINRQRRFNTIFPSYKYT